MHAASDREALRELAGNGSRAIDGAGAVLGALRKAGDAAVEGHATARRVEAQRAFELDVVATDGAAIVAGEEA